MDHLYKLCQKGSEKKGTKTPEPHPKDIPNEPRRANSWLKREKLDFLQILMHWGLPAAPGGGVLWKPLREKSVLPGVAVKKDKAMEACFLSLMGEVHQLTSGIPTSQKEKVAKVKLLPHPGTCPCLVCSQRQKWLGGRESGSGEKGGVHGNSEMGGPSILTFSSAVKLQERLELLEVLRWAVTFCRGEWQNLGLGLFRSHELPSWWALGSHDKALAKGVLKHGFASWEKILKDPNLPFIRLLDENSPLVSGTPVSGKKGSVKLVNSTSKNISPIETTKDSPSSIDIDPMGFGTKASDWEEEENGEKSLEGGEEKGGGRRGDEKVGKGGGEGEGGGGGGALVVLPSKVLVRRLKYMEKMLRRHMVKSKRGVKHKRVETETFFMNARSSGTRELLKEKETRTAKDEPDAARWQTEELATSREEGEETREERIPKKYKYTKAIEVPRDGQGKPILPLILTERLQLVNLGQIVTDRPGWHTERHIFPSGFTTVREQASLSVLNKRMKYTCTILDMGQHLVFSSVDCTSRFTWSDNSSRHAAHSSTEAGSQ